MLPPPQILPLRALASAVGAEVRMVRGSGATPLCLRGAVRGATSGQLHVAVSDPADLAVGDELALALATRAGGALRAVAEVRAVGAGFVVVQPYGLIPTDRREYPRLPAKLAVCFGLARVGLDVERWLAGGVEEPLQVPDGIVDFSVTGLALREAHPPGIGERLLLELRLPRGARPLRCSGRVVRVRPLAATGLFEVGVEFEPLPPEVTRGLVREMLRVQRGTHTR